MIKYLLENRWVYLLNDLKMLITYDMRYEEGSLLMIDASLYQFYNRGKAFELHRSSGNASYDTAGTQ